MAYLDLRSEPSETFLQTYRRLGLAPFKAALYPEARQMPLDEPSHCMRVLIPQHALKHHAAPDVLRGASDALPNLALVSSFGAESVALLHLASARDGRAGDFHRHDAAVSRNAALSTGSRRTAGADNVCRSFGRILSERDPDNTLHQRDTDACCALRKTQVLEKALEGFDGWITGRKRFQSARAPICQPLRSKTAQAGSR